MLVASAIWFNPVEKMDYPIVLTGLRHADIYEKAYKMNIPFRSNTVIEGFITDEHDFLDRYAAKYHAIECKQVLYDTEYRALYSEEIWPE